MKDGVLIGKNGILRSTKPYRDFVCRLEIMVNEKGMGEFHFRSSNGRWALAPIGNRDLSETTGSLAYWDGSKSRPLVDYKSERAPSDKWLILEVTVRGKRAQVSVNHVVTAEKDIDEMADSGFLELNADPKSEFRIRQIEFSELTRPSPPGIETPWGRRIDPLGDSKLIEKDGRLSIAVPGKPPHDLTPKPGPEYNLNAPRVLREVEGDFEARATVLKLPIPKPIAGKKPEHYFAAGLVVLQDDKPNLLRFLRAGHHRGDIFAEWWIGDKLAGAQYGEEPVDGPLHPRIKRTGGTLFLARSRDGKQWTEFARVTELNLSNRLQVGIAVVNVSDQELTAEIEGFTVEFTPRPALPPAKAPSPATIQPLRDLVTATARSRDTVKTRLDAGAASKLDLVAGEIELTEARIRLAREEEVQTVVIGLHQVLVAYREEERDLIAERVKAGVEKEGELSKANARLADARGRLAKEKPLPSAAPEPRPKR